MITIAELENRGTRLSPEDRERIAKALAIPPELEHWWVSWPLMGSEIEVSDADDLSGLGASIGWMSAEHVLSEATEAYPGVVAVKIGYVPIGNCMAGSGDPYFYRRSDGSIVRIPHEAVRGDAFDALDESQIEVVAASIAKLLDVAHL